MRIDVLSLPNSERPSGKRNSTIKVEKELALETYFKCISAWVAELQDLEFEIILKIANESIKCSCHS